MKRRFTFLLAAMLLMNGLSWAQTTINWDATQQGYTNQQVIESVVFDTHVTGTFDKGTNNNAPKYYTSGTAIRCYGGNTITIASSDANLTNITITFGSSDGSNAITTDVGDYSNGTWTGEAESVTFTIGGTSGNRRIAGFAITYGGEAPMPTVATPTFNPGEGTYTEAQNVEINCATDGATIYYSLDGSDPTTNGTEYSSAITIAETTTVKAFAMKQGYNNSPIASATYTITEPAQEQIFSRVDGHAVVEGQTYLIVDVTSGRALTSANGSSSSPAAVEVTISNNQISTDNTDLQWTFEATEGGYIIHPLGSTTSWLYTTSSNTGVRVGTNDNKVWELNITDSNSNYHGFKSVVLGRYLGVYQSNDWRTYTTIHTNINATQIELFVLGDAPAPTPSISAQNVNINYDVTEGNITYTINNGVEGGTLSAATESEWLTLGEVGENVPFTCLANIETTERTATVTLSYMNGEEVLATKEVTVTQGAAPVSYSTIPALFAAATSTETSVYVNFNNWVVSGVSTNGKNVFVTDNNGNGFVIYYTTNMSSTFAAGNILSGTAVSCTLKKYNGFAELLNVTATDLTITSGGTVTVADVALADLAGVNTGALLHYDNLTCVLTTNNAGTATYYNLTDGTTTIQVYNSIYAFGTLVEGKTYNITGVYQQYNNTKEILPRSAADIEEVIATETYTLDIAGYGTSTGGYYLIASPVAEVTPSAENGFITNAYDLYWFDQTQDKEWRNYKVGEGFDLVSGMGYLYASQEGTTLTFEGTPYDGDGSVSLVKDDEAQFAGWNLVGNPFGVSAYIDRDFYIMNPETGAELIQSSGEIAAMQGIFVIANENDEELTFSTEALANNDDKLVLNVTRNRGTIIDRAIVRFGEGGMLPKFQLKENSTKVCFVEGENEYAVVRSANEGEMTINFKASENGIYTLSVNAEEVEMEYLHLIDNMTGADIDLLATPSYTFEANTTDYASRFRLVFNADNSIAENCASNFAYFNGSEWVINNMGEATLQVVDVTGRMISSETVRGNATLNLNQLSGVYMIRLVNGDSVKVQKVVVK